MGAAGVVVEDVADGVGLLLQFVECAAQGARRHAPGVRARQHAAPLRLGQRRPELGFQAVAVVVGRRHAQGAPQRAELAAQAVEQGMDAARRDFAALVGLGGQPHRELLGELHRQRHFRRPASRQLPQQPLQRHHQIHRQVLQALAEEIGEHDCFGVALHLAADQGDVGQQPHQGDDVFFLQAGFDGVAVERAGVGGGGAGHEPQQLLRALQPAFQAFEFSPRVRPRALALCQWHRWRDQHLPCVPCPMRPRLSPCGNRRKVTRRLGKRS